MLCCAACVCACVQAVCTTNQTCCTDNLSGKGATTNVQIRCVKPNPHLKGSVCTCVPGFNQRVPLLRFAFDISFEGARKRIIPGYSTRPPDDN